MDLLADLDDLGQDLESESDNKTEAADDEEMVDVMQAMSDAHKALVQSVQGVDDVNTLVKVYKSPQFNQVVSKIDKFMEQVRPVRNGTVESDPEYPTIVAANSLAFEMDYEIIQVQKFISDHYEPRFPELESLIPTPKEYARAVKLIGNENDMTHLDLKSFLPAATVMVVSTVTATKKRPLLSDSELCRIMLACDIALEIYEGRANVIHTDLAD